MFVIMSPSRKDALYWLLSQAFTILQSPSQDCFAPVESAICGWDQFMSFPEITDISEAKIKNFFVMYLIGLNQARETWNECDRGI